MRSLVEFQPFHVKWKTVLCNSLNSCKSSTFLFHRLYICSAQHSQREWTQQCELRPATRCATFFGGAKNNVTPLLLCRLFKESYEVTVKLKRMCCFWMQPKLWKVLQHCCSAARLRLHSWPAHLWWPNQTNVVFMFKVDHRGPVGQTSQSRITMTIQTNYVVCMCIIMLLNVFFFNRSFSFLGLIIKNVLIRNLAGWARCGQLIFCFSL